MKRTHFDVFIFFLCAQIYQYNGAFSQSCGNIEKTITMSSNCTDDESWVLVFEDNFDAPQLNTTKWELPYQG